MWVTIRYWVLGIALAAMAIWLYGLVQYTRGQASADVKCAKAETVAIQKGVDTHAKVETKVKKLSDPDLDHALSKWMRD